MSEIVIKKEKDEECEDIIPQINEDDCGSGSGVSGVANALGPKVFCEKTQAALKVASEAKQLNLRLREHISKRSSVTAEQLQVESLNDNTFFPYKVGNKRFRVQTPQHSARKANEPLLLQSQKDSDLQPHPVGAVSRCGEIFVTNNARKWTFVCSYCQKSTRDIGEFVCHIKYKHMTDQYYEDGDEDNLYEGEQNELNESYPGHHDEVYNNHDQDYFDCTSYLDVNVHTEADEITNINNGVKPIANKKTTGKSTKEPPSRTIQKTKYVADMDDDDNQRNGKKPRNDVQLKSELYDYEIEEEEEGAEIADDDQDEIEPIDDDNLLFLRSNSVEDATADGGVSKGGSKKYRSHVRGKAYCNLCDKTFQYYSLYRNHMIKHSNITPYKCQYCSKAFKSKQAIRYHMNTHTKEVQHKCPLCPMTYGTENQFITHVLNHENETCFPCMVCAKILSTDQAREEHLATHTEERPYGCTYCNKRFRQKHHLSNHLKLHCQYRCDFCKEEFSSTQTQRRPYACPNCEEYPDIRLQVEKQRSKSLNSSEVNPLELSYENTAPDAVDTAECVDLATDDDDDASETSNSLAGGGASGQKRVTCHYCSRSYKQNSALNYHIRQKHPHIWAEMKLEIKP